MVADSNNPESFDEVLVACVKSGRRTIPSITSIVERDPRFPGLSIQPALARLREMGRLKAFAPHNTGLVFFLPQETLEHESDHERAKRLAAAIISSLVPGVWIAVDRLTREIGEAHQFETCTAVENLILSGRLESASNKAAPIYLDAVRLPQNPPLFDDGLRRPKLKAAKFTLGPSRQFREHVLRYVARHQKISATILYDTFGRLEKGTGSGIAGMVSARLLGEISDNSAIARRFGPFIAPGPHGWIFLAENAAPPIPELNPPEILSLDLDTVSAELLEGLLSDATRLYRDTDGELISLHADERGRIQFGIGHGADIRSVDRVRSAGALRSCVRLLQSDAGTLLRSILDNAATARRGWDPVLVATSKFLCLIDAAALSETEVLRQHLLIGCVPLAVLRTPSAAERVRLSKAFSTRFSKMIMSSESDRVVMENGACYVE